MPFFISVAMCIVRTLCVMVKMAYHVPLGITLISVDLCTFGRVDLADSTALRCGWFQTGFRINFDSLRGLTPRLFDYSLVLWSAQLE